MASEREKMLAGALYDPLDPELVAGRERARDLCHALNATREGEVDARRAILRGLLGRGGDTVWNRHRSGRVGRRRGAHPAGCPDRVPGGHRRRQRRHAGRAGRGVRRGKPCRVIRQITE
jgi:hypothetical protein